MSTPAPQGSLDDEAAETLDLRQRLSRRLPAARTRAQLYQRQVARRMGTSVSAVSRLENALGYPPSLVTLTKYARAVGCRLEVNLIPIDWQDDYDDRCRARR